ncbi:endolytic transglycosylase MltG [Nocardioides jiangxiensis]|uniref:Endolytic murein transglycosylase n=1 Tax=Nocardioides jiangxiensis TaxID=3064524 RepID=A0ABT9AXY1_9ACTN|nr:endolytic transglycosylase MltG [Nocardioides sp. WY-20]MDO7866910.1 endolytic transglycosylase MltG [Nocardioides sp. WY-20]
MTEQQPEQPIEQPATPEPHPAGQHRSPAGHHGDLGAALGFSHDVSGGHRGGRKRVGGGCLLLLVLIVLMGGAVVAGGIVGLDRIKEQFQGPEDYSGNGTTPVLVEVAAGDTADQIGVKLRDAGVVKSAQAYIDYARAHADASSQIQVGFYEVRKEMSAEAAFAVLSDPANQRTDKVTVPEGLRVVDVVALLVKHTDFSKAQFQKVLDHPGQLGLPAYAKGNPEGYLFPATYAFAPNARPVDMLKEMVARWRQAADKVDLEASAKRLGYTPGELMTVAALVEAEGRGDDMPKIARVIYNRIEHPGTAGTVGKLQIDATVNYALGRTGVAHTSNADLDVASPYNTYRNAGLPPGPIEAPGDDALAAAAHPATGDWYYYVTVNLRTGETKFASTAAEFAKYKAEFQHYCATESDRC